MTSITTKRYITDSVYLKLTVITWYNKSMVGLVLIIVPNRWHNDPSTGPTARDT
jgi:hypothetical protein